MAPPAGTAVAATKDTVAEAERPTAHAAVVWSQDEPTKPPYASESDAKAAALAVVVGGRAFASHRCDRGAFASL